MWLVPRLAADACRENLRYLIGPAISAATICNPATTGSPCTTGVPFTSAGVFTINWIAHNDCRFVLATQMVTIMDTELPTFTPACPKGGLVTLNALDRVNAVFFGILRLLWLWTIVLH